MPKRERAKIEDSKIPAKRKTAATAAKRGDGSDIVPRDSDVLCGRGDNINRYVLSTLFFIAEIITNS